MADLRTALASCYRTGSYGVIGDVPGVTLEERRVGALFQLAGWPENFTGRVAVFSERTGLPIPDGYCMGARRADLTAFAIAPEKIFYVDDGVEGMPVCLAELHDEARSAGLYFTDLSHSRTRIRISGQASRHVLSCGLPIDLSDDALPNGGFVQSLVHGIGVLVHRAENDTDDNCVFDIYVPRSFATSFWHWVSAHSESVGYVVR